jgi:dienelactone hydrolase
MAHRHSILVLGDDDARHANCVLDHLHALELHSHHSVRLFNPVGLRDSLFLDLEEFTAVVIHYSILITSDVHLAPAFRDKLRRYRGVKVLFAMDEYRQVDHIAAMMHHLGIDVVFSCVPADGLEAVYGDRLAGVEIVPVLTGYVPDRLVGLTVSRPAARETEIGYRGRSLPYWLGEFGQEKRRIGEGVLDQAPRLSLACDIAWGETDRIYGIDWDLRVASWRAALAVEAGSGIVDHDGSIQARTEAYVSAHPGATFVDVHRDVLHAYEDKADLKVISSRVFEAIALRTALVMFPGRYSGVVEPGIHYLELKRDFSNLDEVVHSLRDLPVLEAMIDRAYRDVVDSGRYSYREFVKIVDGVLDRHISKRAPRNRVRPRHLLARAERFAVETAACVGDLGLRCAVTTSILAREPDLRLLVWRHLRSGHRRPPVATRRVIGDMLKLHLLRTAQSVGDAASIPFHVEAEFRPGGEVMFRSRPARRPVPTSQGFVGDQSRSGIEAAIRDGRLRTFSWEHLMFAGYVELPVGYQRTLRVGSSSGYDRLDALAALAERFPAEAAAALTPLFPRTCMEGDAIEPLSSTWTNLNAWAIENAAVLDRLGFVRAFEAADRKRREQRPTSAGALTQPAAIRREQARVRHAHMRTLELDAAAIRCAPHALFEHDRRAQVYAGARYEIEVVSWDAYPGFAVPALIYRPRDETAVARPGVIVALGSQVNVATHDESYSAQRHAANLALRGFTVMVFASGLCFNGLNGERLDNSYAFETYGRLSGSGFTSRSIDVLMYLRAFDYMAGRPDVDSNRIGATGYSYGGRMAYYLALYEQRVAALGIAAASVLADGDDSQATYSARRDAAMIMRVSDRFTAGEPPRTATAVGDTTDGLGESALVAPRPFRIVLGAEDPGTSVAIARERVDSLRRLYCSLDPVAIAPDVVVDEGSHHFDAARRRIIEDWLAEVLRAEPILDPPAEREHQTPVLERSLLERRPPRLGTVTTRGIHVRRALESIASQRECRWIDRSTRDQARAKLRELVKLAPCVAPRAARPVVLGERTFGAGAQMFIAKFWLLPLSDHFDAAALTLTSIQGRGGTARLYVLDGEHLLPERQALGRHLKASNTVLVLYLPGFGPLQSPQERLGDLAMRISSRLDRTLLGVGVEAVEAGLDLIETFGQGATVTAESFGVDAGTVISFATALDDRIGQALVYDGLVSFQRFFTSAVEAIPPPTLAVAGMAAQVDISDLQRIAGNDRLLIESESDLRDYVLDLRPSNAGAG